MGFDDDHPFKVFKGFNIQILKDMKTSDEMVDFVISLKKDGSKEELEQGLFSSEIIADLLSINTDQVKDVSPELLEKTKRKIILYAVCHGIMDEAFENLKKSVAHLKTVAPEMKVLLEDTEMEMLKLCADYGYCDDN